MPQGASHPKQVIMLSRCRRHAQQAPESYLNIHASNWRNIHMEAGAQARADGADRDGAAVLKGRAVRREGVDLRGDARARSAPGPPAALSGRQRQRMRRRGRQDCQAMQAQPLDDLRKPACLAHGRRRWAALMLIPGKHVSGGDRAARPHQHGRSLGRVARVAAAAAGGAAAGAQVREDGADLVARRLQLSRRQARSGRAVRGSAGARGGPGPRAALATGGRRVSAHATSTVEEGAM